MEEHCTDPACHDNHHILLCKFGCECNKESCEFRHPAIHVPEMKNDGAYMGSSWEGPSRRTKEMRVDDMIVSLDLEDQLMFENEIGKYMCTKMWPSNNLRGREEFSQGKSLKIEVSRDGTEQYSSTQDPCRTRNLIVLKDNEDDGSELSDLRHSLRPKLNEKGKRVKTDTEDSRRQWRYERKNCYESKTSSQQAIKLDTNRRVSVEKVS